jgi:hypothetical protein
MTATRCPFVLALTGRFRAVRSKKAFTARWAILQGKRPLPAASRLTDSNRCFRHYARKQENPARWAVLP